MGKPRSTFGLLRAMFFNPKAMIGLVMLGFAIAFCISPPADKNGPVFPLKAVEKGDWVPLIMCLVLGMGGLAMVWFSARRFGGIYLHPRRVSARVTHVSGLIVKGQQDITYAYEIDGRVFKKRVTMQVNRVVVGQLIEVIIDARRPSSCVLRNDPFGALVLADD